LQLAYVFIYWYNAINVIVIAALISIVWVGFGGDEIVCSSVSIINWEIVCAMHVWRFQWWLVEELLSTFS